VTHTTPLSSKPRPSASADLPPLVGTESRHEEMEPDSAPNGMPVSDLMQHAQEQGYLTVDELATASNGEPGSADEITAHLSRLSIPIVEVAENGVLVEVDPRETAVTEILPSGDDLTGVSIDDPVRIYLREIGRVALLTGEQEVTLSQAMEARDYLVNLREANHPLNGAVSTATSIGFDVYRSFIDGWPLVYDFYRTAIPNKKAKSRQRVLDASDFCVRRDSGRCILRRKGRNSH
jgi:RNA polymerase primary sigma factor